MENIQKGLDKVGKRIASTSLLVGLLLIVMGVIETKNGERNGEYTSSSNGSVQTLYLGTTRTIYTSPYSSYIECEFSPSNSRDYYLHIENGYLESITNNYDSSVSYTNYNSYNDVTVYNFYGYSYETYKFRIYAYGHSVNVKVADYSY